MENFEKGEEQGSEGLLYGCNGGEFVFCPAATRELRKCFLDGLQGTCEQSFAVGDFCGSFSLSFNGGLFRGVLYFRNHTQNDLEFSLKLKPWDPCN
jgi:hypothetical protein